MAQKHGSDVMNGELVNFERLGADNPDSPALDLTTRSIVDEWYRVGCPDASS